MEAVKLFTAAIVKEQDRRVIYSFDGPVLTGGEFENDVEVWNSRIKIEFSHSKDRKRFEASVWRCAAAKRDGFTMERFAVFSGDNAMIATEPAARYGKNAFVSFISRAMDVCIQIANDEDNVSLAAELVREARSFAAAAV